MYTDFGKSTDGQFGIDVGNRQASRLTDAPDSMARLWKYTYWCSQKHTVHHSTLCSDNAGYSVDAF